MITTMQKRTKLLILIIVGLLLLLLGLWIFLSPILKERAAQQPSAPTQGTPYMAQPGQKNPTPGAPQATGTSTAPAPVDAMMELQNKAKSLAERIGSGSSQTGFLGYQDAMLDMTANGKTALQKAQTALQQAHPAQEDLYTITTRAVSSTVTKGKIGDAQITISIETVQTENAGLAGVTPKPSAKRVDVTFVKQTDGSYVADAIAWSDIEL